MQTLSASWAGECLIAAAPHFPRLQPWLQWEVTTSPARLSGALGDNGPGVGFGWHAQPIIRDRALQQPSRASAACSSSSRAAAVGLLTPHKAVERRGLCFLQQTVGRLLITPRRGPGSMGARRWTKACTASPGASLTLDPCRWLRARGSHFRTKLGLGHRFVPPTPLRNVQTHSPFYCTPHTPLHCTLHVERSTARTPARRLPLHRPAAFACRPPPQPPACLLDPPQHRTPRLRMSTPASPRNTAEGVLEPDITTSPSL